MAHTLVDYLFVYYKIVDYLFVYYKIVLKVQKRKNKTNAEQAE